MITLGHLSYMSIDLSIFLPGLVMSRFVRRDFLSLFLAMLVTSFPFLLWDSEAVNIGTWEFNREYITGVMVGNLPVEEVMFFFVAPFSSLVFYDYFAGKLGSPQRGRSDLGLLAPVPALLGLAGITWSHSYTGPDAVFATVAMVMLALYDGDLGKSKVLWGFLAVSYIPFMIFDHFLTSLPIVEYGRGSILGPRVFSIPLEDFLYSFSLLTINTVMYRQLAKRL